MLSDAARVLLLLPVLVLVLLRWWRPLGMTALPLRRLVFWLCMAMLVASAGLGIYGNTRAVRGAYVPARMVGGRVVSGGS